MKSSSNSHSVQIIPKHILFGNPDKSTPRISPDGKKLAYIAENSEGVLNIFILDFETGNEDQITNDNDRGITAYQWHFDSQNIIFVQDTNGNENWRLYVIDLKSKSSKCLTPFDNVQVQVIDQSHLNPDIMLIGMNKDNPEVHDVYSLNLLTGELHLREKNPGNITDWLSDYNLKIRGALRTNENGSFDLLLRESEEEDFKKFYSWTHEDSANSGPLTFDKSGKYIYLVDSTNANATRLVKMNISTKHIQIIFQDDTYDVSGVVIHPLTLKLQIIGITREKEHHKVIDDSIKDDIEIIKKKHPKGEFFIANRTLDNKITEEWVVGYVFDNGPVPYYKYTRSSKEFHFLFYHQQRLKDYALSTIEPIKFQSRDGLTIHGYISFPIGKQENLPLVVNIHGGPWIRDEWGFDPEVQLFTNRGYCCLQINFRGSSGYGKNFLNAGDKQWGRKMLDDVVDGVHWTIAKGYVNSKKIAIYGGSYGGYTALAAACFTNVFSCAIDIMGPSNLITFIQSIPEYWKPYLEMLHRRVGDPDEEYKFLKEISPLFHVENISIPLLIAHGANDPRVKIEESQRIVDILKKNKISHKFMLFEDEGHGLVKPENRIAFYSELESFLHEHLGGMFEIS